MMHIANHAFCAGRIAENEKGNSLCFAKATLMMILSRQNAWLQILFFEIIFFKEKGPAAEGKAMGPSLKLEVDLRRENLEHAMHPLQGCGGS